MAVALLGAACGSDADDKQPASDASSHAVAIRADGCGPTGTPRRGAGTMLGGDQVLTAAHPVAGASAIEVTDSQGRTRSARIGQLDTTLDLAVLVVAGLDAPPIALASFSADHEATFIGHAPDDAVPFRVVRRVAITFSDIYDEGRHQRAGYELAAAVEPGDSGAGLIVGGNLGGVVFAASSDGVDRAWATDIVAAEAILGGESSSPVDVSCVP